MMGGGYVVGGEVARVLVDVHTRMHLKFTPIEDATLGFWLMAMDLRHIDHPKFFTWAAPCCFKAPVRKPGERFVTRFQLAAEFEDDLCSADPWLVLHKIDSPTKMRYVGSRVANCSAQAVPEAWALAPSIESHVPAEKREGLAQQRDAALLRQQQQQQAAGAAATGRQAEDDDTPTADILSSGSGSSQAASATTAGTAAGSAAKGSAASGDDVTAATAATAQQ
jgi:galactosylxylosylprotein 3-beta-galactosyltransferase